MACEPRRLRAEREKLAANKSRLERELLANEIREQQNACATESLSRVAVEVGRSLNRLEAKKRAANTQK